MEQFFISDETFDKVDFKANPPKVGEYECCTFSSCDFSNTDLSEIKFVDCVFDACNLSLVKLSNTVLRDITFKGCKMLGLRFDSCNQFGLSFSADHCVLNHSSFYKVKLVKTSLKDCQLQETDFSECDLTASILRNCDLFGAMFDGTILEKTDLRTSCKYVIDPDKNRIKKAKFSLQGIPGLLTKYDIEIDYTN